MVLRPYGEVEFPLRSANALPAEKIASTWEKLTSRRRVIALPTVRKIGEKTERPRNLQAVYQAAP